MIFVDQPINTGFSYSDVSQHCSGSSWPSVLSVVIAPVQHRTFSNITAAYASHLDVLTFDVCLQDPRDRVYNEHTVAADMLDFLQAFLDGKLFSKTYIRHLYTAGDRLAIFSVLMTAL